MKSLLRSDTANIDKIKKISVKDIVIVALMSTILLTVQIVFAALPNIELVTLLIIIYTLVFKRRTILIIYIFALLEGLVYGFGPWWVMYLYVWTVLYLIVTLLKNNTSVIVWSIVSGIYGLIFGALCSLVYFFMGGLKTVIAFWIAGIQFDIIHSIANFIVCLILFKPLYMLLKRLNS